MSDAFRPEVLAAFMQRVVDDQVLPVLFLRTVRPFCRRISLTRVGDPSGVDVQVAAAVCVDHAALPAHHEASLEDSVSLGGIHPMRQGDCAQLVQRNPTASAGAAQGIRRQAAHAARADPRVCVEQYVASSLPSRIALTGSAEGGNTNSRIDSLLAILQGDE